MSDQQQSGSQLPATRVYQAAVKRIRSIRRWRWHNRLAEARRLIRMPLRQRITSNLLTAIIDHRRMAFWRAYTPAEAVSALRREGYAEYWRLDAERVAWNIQQQAAALPKDATMFITVRDFQVIADHYKSADA